MDTKIDQEVFDQIMLVRDTGLVNMLAISQVRAVAEEMECEALVDYIDRNPKKYVNFIFTGKEEI